MLTTDPDWQPGDPLWVTTASASNPDNRYVRGGHSSYLFNIRPDNDGPEPTTPDAARWPTPMPGYDLKDDDEIGNLIRLVRMDRSEHRESA